MIVSIGPLENAAGAPCTHERCDGRPARWIVYRGVLRDHSCSVHLARFAERGLVARDAAPAAQAVYAENIVNSHARCGHPRCDGRAAKWTFPQTSYLPTGALRSCSVHLPRFCEIVLKYHLNTRGRVPSGTRPALQQQRATI